MYVAHFRFFFFFRSESDLVVCFSQRPTIRVSKMRLQKIFREWPLQLLLHIATTVLFYTNFRFIDHYVYNIMITFPIFEELTTLIFLAYLSSFLTFCSWTINLFDPANLWVERAEGNCSVGNKWGASNVFVQAANGAYFCFFSITFCYPTLGWSSL
jgi:hypothetical protein